MQFTVEIEQVQPVLKLQFSADLAQPGIVCIAGKNGAGKTTLARAIMNFTLADTFTRTAADGIFSADSVVRYSLDGGIYEYRYDSALGTINTRAPVPAALRRLVSVELPMPHGHRFNFFKTLFNADHDIRSRIVLGRYERPERLIAFLSGIYGDSRFDDLIEVPFRGGRCCCIVREDGRYLREDYFSSGEYFLISLFRKVTEGSRLVVIDEIDISLDASAQARLAQHLRSLCHEFGVKLVFTSHSLALMQTLEDGELLYLERGETEASLTPMSFSFVKFLMFGFPGYDRFIIAEDEVLKGFLEFVIGKYCPPPFQKYVIVTGGSGPQAVEMMRRNRRSQFLGPDANVITILDGDMSRKAAARGEHCIPIVNVETALHRAYREPGFSVQFLGGEALDPKGLYKQIVRRSLLSEAEIFAIICQAHDAEMREFSALLTRFLGRAAN
ncbi:AAA family ATPase [Ramlibacter monticola]|uniref:AAA family ATPase n=1 Tax=Ramlibacter monticola TaxID=1926872 RepID=A0A937CTQ9_9BURK|nr:AAA family ATPase [Ramlibacter monticola]MBL0391232.1 AAA family ATPase [Ramlibacter monticola]